MAERSDYFFDESGNARSHKVYKDTHDTLERAVKYALEFKKELPVAIVKRLENALENHIRETKKRKGGDENA